MFTVLTPTPTPLTDQDGSSVEPTFSHKENLNANHWATQKPKSLHFTALEAYNTFKHHKSQIQPTSICTLFTLKGLRAPLHAMAIVSHWEKTLKRSNKVDLFSAAVATNYWFELDLNGLKSCGSGASDLQAALESIYSCSLSIPDGNQNGIFL